MHYIHIYIFNIYIDNFQQICIDTLYKLLSNKHTNLQKSHNQLKKRLAEEEQKRRMVENEFQNLKTNNHNTKDSTIEIQRLKENENRLCTEIQELREQNELLEFRLLELEYYNTSKVSIMQPYYYMKIDHCDIFSSKIF